MGNKRVFATSLETKYPHGLCLEIAHAFRRHAVARGAGEPRQTLICDNQLPGTNAGAKAVTGVQAAKPLHSTLVRTFKSKLARIMSDQQQLVWPRTFELPADAKPILKLCLGGVGEDCTSRLEIAHAALREHSIDVEIDVAIPPLSQLQIFGVFWDPLDFVKEAVKAGHPLDGKSSLPWGLEDAIQTHLNMDDCDIARMRARWVRKWLRAVCELKERESQLRADMSARLSDAVKCKRLAVFEAMLHECEFPDAGVLDELKDGADLVGSVPRTGMLPTKFKPALLTLSGLASLAAKMRSVVQFSTGSSGDQEIDNAVYEQTLQEVQCGWLSGPLIWSDVDTSWPVRKRFGLKQKHKVRLIDDFTASGVNDAVTSFEAPTLHTVDVTASMLQTWFATAAKCGKPSALEQCLQTNRHFGAEPLLLSYLCVQPGNTQSRSLSLQCATLRSLKGSALIPEVCACLVVDWSALVQTALDKLL